MTTALMRLIERQNEERRQELWTDRGMRTQRRKWAIDHLMDTGQITPEQHDAAIRYAEQYALATDRAFMRGSQMISVHPAWDLSCAAEVARIERGWRHEEARAIVSAMQNWVRSAPLTTKPRMKLMQRLFALPAPSWQLIRVRDPHNSVERVSSLLDVMAAFWADRDTLCGAA